MMGPYQLAVTKKGMDVSRCYTFAKGVGFSSPCGHHCEQHNARLLPFRPLHLTTMSRVTTAESES